MIRTHSGRHLATALSVGLLATCLLTGAEIPLADFEGAEMRFSFFAGDEFPGAKGHLVREKLDSESGKAARLDADFAGGGMYVQMGMDLEPPIEMTELRFRIKTSQVSKVRLRISDSTGQVHQQLLAAPASGNWQDVKVTRFTGGEDAMHWGGANDGVWHGPAAGIAFLLEKDQLQGKTGTLWLDDVRAVGRQVMRLELTFQQRQPGNVFLEGEPVGIEAKTTANEVSWSLRDWQGTVAASGKNPATKGKASIEPRLTRNGHFVLEAEVTREGQSKKVSTSLAILPPLDLRTVEDSPFGVCTHFAQGWDVQLVPLIARAGIKHVRDELYWDSVEENKGQFDVPNHFRNYMAALKSHHLAPLIPLTFENPHYDGGQTPHTESGFQAYASYGAEVLRSFPEIGSVEIWNEYNGTFCKGPATENRSATYAAMLAKAQPVLKDVRPGVRIVGAGTAGVPFPYLEKLFQAGALAHMDVVSVHPYRYRNTPEGIETEMQELVALIRQYDPDHAQAKPVWATEYGWDAHPAKAEGDLAITELDQAKFLVRGHALLLAGGVEKAFWYLFRDSPEFPTMGLVRGDDDPQGRHTPKPAFTAYATLIRQLQGTRFVEREKAGPGIYALHFEESATKRSVRMLWSIKERRLALRVMGESATLTDFMGASSKLNPGDQTLTLTGTPIYLQGVVEGLPVPGAEHEVRGPEILADSVAGFSSKQGGGDWFYGFEEPAAGATRFRPLAQYRVTDWTREWVNEVPWLSVNATYQHPSTKDGKPIPVVRRWISKLSGSARLILDANLESAAGDGVNLRVRLDGKEVLAKKLGGGEPIRLSQILDLELKPGLIIDLVVDSGASANIDHDGTSLHARVQRRS